MFLLLVLGGCQAPPPPRPPPEIPTAGQKLSMVPPRWVEISRMDGKPVLETRCGHPPREFYVDKTAKGGPYFSINQEGSEQRWRLGEIQGDYGADVWRLPLEGPGLVRSDLVLRWLDRPRGIAEWSGGPFVEPVEVVSGDKDLLLDTVREPCADWDGVTPTSR